MNRTSIERRVASGVLFSAVMITSIPDDVGGEQKVRNRGAALFYQEEQDDVENPLLSGAARRRARYANND